VRVEDLTPEAREAVAAWLRQRADSHDARASAAAGEEGLELVADFDRARGATLRDAAADLLALGPDSLPFGVELRASAREALPSALRGVARALELSACTGGAVSVAFDPDAAVSVTFSSPLAEVASQAPARRSEHARLAAAASALVEAVDPDYVGDLPAALSALASALSLGHDPTERLRALRG